jgi:hypothetical protein
MVARQDDVDNLLTDIGDGADGIIVWEMFKQVSGTYNDETSTKSTFNAACKHY